MGNRVLGVIQVVSYLGVSIFLPVIYSSRYALIDVSYFDVVSFSSQLVLVFFL